MHGFISLVTIILHPKSGAFTVGRLIPFMKWKIPQQRFEHRQSIHKQFPRGKSNYATLSETRCKRAQK